MKQIDLAIGEVTPFDILYMACANNFVVESMTLVRLVSSCFWVLMLFRIVFVKSHNARRFRVYIVWYRLFELLTTVSSPARK